MATLTAAELNKIRLMTGALETATFTDEIIQAEYDLALADAPGTDDVLPYTYVYVLRLLWGFQRLKQDRTTTHGDKQTRSQIDTSTKEKLDYWEARTGLGNGVLRVGSLGLSLDYTQHDADAELTDP